MKRIEWIDYGKSLAIFAVVLLHVHCDNMVVTVINSFIMPLFFLMSGRLFSYQRNPSFTKFAKKRFRQILVPYMWIGVLSWLCWVLVLRHYGDDVNDNVAWYIPLYAQFAGISPFYHHNTPCGRFLPFSSLRYSIIRLANCAGALGSLSS